MKDAKTVKSWPEWAFLAALLVFSVTVIRTAWLSDDALITLRAAMNFSHGFGPNFNLDESAPALSGWIISARAFTITNLLWPEIRSPC